MKAFFYDKKSSPKKLVCRELAQPEPKDDEVLVKVVAISPNAADYRSMKIGIKPKKKVYGSAVSGIVVSAGKHVQKLKPGDAVLGDLADFGFGGFAEFVAAPEKAFVQKPEGLSFEAASALPVAATTALQALQKEGNIQKGQKVLIIGSSGGVGTFAVQLASYFETEITAVCSSRNLAQSSLLGADFVIDYTKEDFTQSDKKYDLIIAINGTYPLLACKRTLSPNGTYVMVGGSYSQIFKALLFGAILSLGSKKIRSLSAKPQQEDLSFVATLAEKDTIKPVIEKVFSFKQTNEAVSYLAGGHAQGKIVITSDGQKG